ncbi:MAG: pyridoxal-phosphate dependent enzyme [Saprospiraceae bacterium]|nr:pyridoxal-phosphate dependent enzyme [Saprospiraceae bacterium]
MKTIYSETPLLQSFKLQKEKGLNVFYKMECHQPVGSFKIRGMENLCRYYLAKGQRKFIASSGGNAGLAMAYVGQKLGAEIKIVVPKSTSEFMVDKIRNLKVDVEIYGTIWNETHEYALRQAEETKATYVSPFDDVLLWEGHASMIDECAKAMPKPTKIVLSVGGGGLLLGVLEGMKRNGWEDVEVIAVETFGAASFHGSMTKNELIELDTIQTIATSLGAKKIATEAFKQAKEFNVTPFLVRDEDTVRAMFSFLNEYNVLVEPACGAALSYPLLYSENLNETDTILVIACGGVNTSFEQLVNYKFRFLD